jgi:hypothetical protein
MIINFKLWVFERNIDIWTTHDYGRYHEAEIVPFNAFGDFAAKCDLAANEREYIEKQKRLAQTRKDENANCLHHYGVNK